MNRTDLFRMLMFVVLPVVLASCVGRNNDKQTVIVDFSQTLPAEAVFSGYRTVYLESDTSCMISEAGKLLIEDFLYVRDETRVHVFDTDGHFEYTINKFGHGNGEYPDIRDYSVYNSQVYILSRVKKCIYKYGNDGEFLQKIPLNDWYDGLHVYNDTCLFLYSGFSNEQEYNIVAFNPACDNYFAKFAHYGKNNGYSTGHQVFHPAKGGLYVTIPFDYTIYSLSPDSMSPVCHLDFLTEERLTHRGNLETISEKSQNGSLVRHIERVYSPDGKSFQVVVRKFVEGEGQKPFLIEFTSNGKTAEVCALSAAAVKSTPFLINPGLFHDDELVCIVPAMAYRNLSSHFGIHIGTDAPVENFDNPVIVFNHLQSLNPVGHSYGTSKGM